MSLAPGPFWLDGGYDRATVDGCPHAPAHRWWEFHLGDVIQASALSDPDEMMCICKGCYVPRCGHVENDPDPCVLPRHHGGNHLPASEAALLAVPDHPPAAP